MNLFTNQWLASLGIAAAAAITVGSTASSSGADATTCQTWHPQSIVADGNQQTLHPQYPLAVQYQHTWNPPHALGEQHQHSWNPEHPVGARNQQTWNPEHPLAEQTRHSWNPAGDHPDACALGSPTPPQTLSEEERASGARADQ